MWHYTINREKFGPVPEFEILELADQGKFDPETDLVWCPGMEEWKVAIKVPAFQFRKLYEENEPAESHQQIVADTNDASSSTEYTKSQMPYTYERSAQAQSDPQTYENLPYQPIPPGSERINVLACFSRAFEFLKVHFAGLTTIAIIYLAVIFSLNIATDYFEGLVGGSPFDPGKISISKILKNPDFKLSDLTGTKQQFAVAIAGSLVTQLTILFLSLGITRVCLNIIDGKPYHPQMVFGEGRRYLRVLGAGFIYSMAIMAGTMFFIIPGIYFMLLFGQFKNAIIDKDMGVTESLMYSVSITHRQKLPLLLIWILSLALSMLGILLFLVGALFTFPIIWVTGVLAYRWMQYGSLIIRPLTSGSEH